MKRGIGRAAKLARARAASTSAGQLASSEPSPASPPVERWKVRNDPL